MNTSLLARRFVGHEGSSSVRLLRRFIRDHDRGTHELEYNVWHVVVDLDRRVIHLTHDFDPLEGSMPLDDFLRDLDQVCPE